MRGEIADIVATLPELTDVTGVWKVADQRFAGGDADFVSALGVALVAEYGGEPDRNWQYRSVFDHILRLLAISPDPSGLAPALRVIAAAGARRRAVYPYAASLLTARRGAEDLAVVFAGGGRVRADEELRACLVHELLLRGNAAADMPALSRWATAAHRRGHPLAWLPLNLSALERPDLPEHGPRGSGHAIPYGPSGRGHAVVGTGAPSPAAVPTTTPTRSAASTAAVANWAEESNGRSEAASFDLTEPVGPKAVAGLVKGLPLDCLAGADRAGVSVFECTAPRVWRVLFAAASTGGAYNHGCYGAYGRLAAWRSLAGLTGLADDAPFEAVEARVLDSAWYSFTASTPWFEEVAWDIGLVGIAPDRRALAVLAATDTD